MDNETYREQMRLNVDIDEDSGFCRGVISAIGKAEQLLAQNKTIYSIGAIVHNEEELGRLERLGLKITDTASLQSLAGRCDGVLIRAHGEPPQTYSLIREAGLALHDCTCPVVLGLQKKIRQACLRGSFILIFGKKGHAEVLGLTGQCADPSGIAVIEGMDDCEAFLRKVEEGALHGRKVEVFSQTTKSPLEYTEICLALSISIPDELLEIHDTICTQVSSRHGKLTKFAGSHDAVLFVSGKESSNGKVLLELCRNANERTYHICGPADIRAEWFSDGMSVGICGATSTPRWLLEAVKENLANL